MRNISRWLYDHAPIAGQDLMCTLAGQVRNWQRYDLQFESRCRFFSEASHWGRTQAEEYQLQQLRQLLEYCRKEVPFYRERLRLVEGANSIRGLEQWRSLPILSKDEVRRGGPSLVSSEFSMSQLVVSHSGGSTGMPLRCYHDPGALKEVYACLWATQRPGVSRTDHYASFQGVPIIPPGQKSGPLWRVNLAMHQRLYSIFHLSEATIGRYIEDLDRFRPIYLTGYANSLYLLAKLAEEQKRLPKYFPAAVFSTSEQLFPHCRQTIERVFRTQVWDAYSQDETCGSITQYECGFYHYDRAYGYMEFEDVDLLPGNRRLAEIICTGFLNRAWPLLRYRPGDLVEYEPAERCPDCGRPGPLIYAIRGRTGDSLLLPSGRRFPHISLIVKSLRGVRQIQLVQLSLTKILIRFVPAEDFGGTADVESMIRSFSRAINEAVTWETETVAEIPRTVGGKFMSIISQLPQNPARGAAPLAAEIVSQTSGCI